MTSFLAKGGNIEELLLQWRKEYGPFYEFHTPASPAVMIVSDPEVIKEVYELKQYHKSPRYKDLLPILGSQSLVITEGSAWKKQRETFNPGFSSTFLRAALPGFVSCTSHMVQELERAAADGRVVSMHELSILTTTGVICKVGFGEDINLFESGGISNPLWTSFRHLGEHVAWFLDNVPFNWMKNLPWNKSKTARLQEQLDKQLLDILMERLAHMGIPESALEHTASSSSNSSSSSVLPEGAAGGCPMHGAVAATSSSSSSGLATTTTAAVAAAVADDTSTSGAPSECPFHAATPDATATTTTTSSRSSSSSSSSSAADVAMLEAKDILSLAVKLSASEGQLDKEVLLSQMKTFFAAGHDTTASLVAWAVYYLLQNPEVDRRLREEVDRVLAGAEAPSYQQLSEMKYLNMVVKETLRYRPPVGLLARWAPEGTTLRGYDTSNKVLLVSPYIQHMDESVWGADAAVWNPERWADEEGAAQKAGPYSYMPFSRGPRDCIGARFALLEAKTILSMLYSKFELEFVGERPEEVMMSVTAHPKFGVPVRVRARHQPQQQQQRDGAEVAAAGAAAAATASV